MHERLSFVTAKTLFPAKRYNVTLASPPTHPHRERVPGRPQAPVLIPPLGVDKNKKRVIKCGSRVAGKLAGALLFLLHRDRGRHRRAARLRTQLERAA